MTTGTVLSPSITLSKHKEDYTVNLTLTNGEGAELFHGQEVHVTGNLEVSKRDVATQKSIGVVSIGGVDGERVTIATSFQRTLKVIAIGGTLTADDQVVPDGSRDSSGRPGYKAAVTTNYVSGIVLSGNTVGLEALIGVVRTPYLI